MYTQWLTDPLYTTRFWWDWVLFIIEFTTLLMSRLVSPCFILFIQWPQYWWSIYIQSRCFTHPVIKHGWLENPPFIDDLPSYSIKTWLRGFTCFSIFFHISLWFMIFPLSRELPSQPRLITTTGSCGADGWRGLNCFNSFPSWHRGR